MNRRTNEQSKIKLFVYILRTRNDKLYIGQTNNLDSRVIRHKNGKGARFIKGNDAFFDVVYFEEYSTRLEAMRREKQLKGWTRAKKEALISRDLELLKRL